MLKREEIIKYLDAVVENNADRVSGLVVVPIDVVNAASCWLKRLDAKLLTLEEVKFSCPDEVYFETRFGLVFCCIKDEIDSDYFAYFVYGRDIWFQRQYEFYNKTWRCWIRRPTEEQRKLHFGRKMMLDILKTIHQLEDYLRTYDQYQPQNLPYDVVKDAIELLNEKAFNPSSIQAEVLSIDTISKFNLVWLETKYTRYPFCVFVTDRYSDNTIGFKNSPDEPEWFLNIEDPEGYNKTWRCWNMYPSYERRKEVEWLN